MSSGWFLRIWDHDLTVYDKVVLTSSLEDPSFNLKGIKYFNTFMQYLMGSMIVASFIFSMGNRPAACVFSELLTFLWNYSLIIL